MRRCSLLSMLPRRPSTCRLRKAATAAAAAGAARAMVCACPPLHCPTLHCTCPLTPPQFPNYSMEGTLDPVAGDDIVTAALKVLHTADPHEKARRTNAIVEMWEDGRIGLPQAGAPHPPPPDRPARESTKVRWLWASRAAGACVAAACTHAALQARLAACLLLQACPSPASLASVAVATCRPKGSLLQHPPLQVKLVPADKAPKRGKGGSLASRQAMLHALVHIENAAIDLAW